MRQRRAETRSTTRRSRTGNHAAEPHWARGGDIVRPKTEQAASSYRVLGGRALLVALALVGVGIGSAPRAPGVGARPPINVPSPLQGQVRPPCGLFFFASYPR